MPDQIFTPGPNAAPLIYTVPGVADVVPLACQAVFNGSGASGDFVPTLIFRSQAGHVISRVPTSTTVSAGDSAEVTFAPFLRASPAFPVLQSRGTRLYTTIGQVTTSGVAAEIQPDAGGPLPYAGMRPLSYLFGARFNTFKVSAFRAAVYIVVKWPAANYDRYIEINVPSFFTSGLALPYRIRGSLSPDSDYQVISALVDGDETTPVSIGFNCFQASGINRTIQSWIVADEWPILNPPLVWS